MLSSDAWAAAYSVLGRRFGDGDVIASQPLKRHGQVFADLLTSYLERDRGPRQ